MPDKVPGPTPVMEAEMDPASPEFQAMLTGADKPPVEAQKDVKPTEPASSAGAPDKEPVESKPEDAAALHKQISGLKAELSRREGNAKRVHELEEQLTALEGRVKESQTLASGTSDEKLKAAIAKLDGEQIIEKRVEWADELADARAAYREAQRDGDNDKQRQAAERLTTARQVLSALEKAQGERLSKAQSEATTREKEAAALSSEIDHLFTDAYGAFPDLKDKDSALWKAGNAEFTKMPVLMEKLGPIGELVALSLALAKHPEFLKATGDASQVRKDTLKEIESVAHKALSAGGGTAGTKPIVDYAAMNREQFEAAVQKAKGG